MKDTTVFRVNVVPTIFLGRPDFFFQQILVVFCTAPRNVIFPRRASHRLPIFAKAIIAHRPSNCPFGPVVLRLSFSTLCRPLWLILHPLSCRGYETPRRTTHLFHICPFFLILPFSSLPFSSLLFSPVCELFVFLIFLLASIFALTKRNRLCTPSTSDDGASCLNYSNLRQANESATQTPSRRHEVKAKTPWPAYSHGPSFSTLPSWSVIFFLSFLSSFTTALSLLLRFLLSIGVLASNLQIAAVK